MGQVLQAGVGQAPARQAALKAGLADSTSATTINRVCGSGLKAIMLGRGRDPRRRRRDRRRRRHGEHEPGPVPDPKARFGYRLGNAELIDATVHDGLWCSTESCHMGTHAERVAMKNEVSRADQDQFALESHQKALAAIDAGRFNDEIVPVPVRAKRRRPSSTPTRGRARDTEHRGARPAQAGLRAARPRARFGAACPTAPSPPATRPGITDGAAATVVASERAVERSASSHSPGSSATPRPRSRRSGSSSPRSRASRSCSHDRDADRGVRPGRDQRGVRGPGAGRRARARLRLVEGQRQRRRHRAWPPHRRQRSAYRCNAAPRAATGERVGMDWQRFALAEAALWRWHSSGSESAILERAAMSGVAVVTDSASDLAA